MKNKGRQIRNKKGDMRNKKRHMRDPKFCLFYFYLLFLKIVQVFIYSYNQFSMLASRKTIFYCPIVISVRFFIHTFLSPYAILSSSTFIIFFLLKQRISHLLNSLLKTINACCLETEWCGIYKSTWYPLLF